jgi:myosin-7
VIELTDGNLGESVLSGDWGEGYCERTRMKGCFPVESVYVLPAIKRPPSDILVSKLCYSITVISNYRK